MSQSKHQLLTQFNTVLLNFLSELDNLFPDSYAKTYHSMISLSLNITPAMWIKTFMDSSIDHGIEIMSSNEDYFLNTPLAFTDKLDLKKYYTLSNGETRISMWKYMQTLFLLGCGYSGYSPEFLQTVENVAKLNGDKNISTKSIRKTIEKM